MAEEWLLWAVRYWREGDTKGSCEQSLLVLAGVCMWGMLWVRPESGCGVQDRSQVPSAAGCALPPLLAGFGRSPQSSARPQADPLRPPRPQPAEG